MEQLQVTFKVITPLVLSGANQAQAEFRPASLKGAMRFWYRAMDPNYREREDSIFGGAGEGKGQASFLLKYKPTDWVPKTWNKYHYSNFNVGSGRNTKNGVIYFAYPFDTGKDEDRVQRQYLPAGTTINISVLFRKSADAITRRTVLGSLWLLGHLGGMGSRSRRGFGTVALNGWELLNGDSWPELNELQIAHKAKTAEEWMRRFESGLTVLREWFGSFVEVDHTVIDPNCRYMLINEWYTKKGNVEAWAKALNRCGRLMQDYRLRKPPDYQNVKQYNCLLDEDLAKKNPNLKAVDMTTGPERIWFGLPLAFRYSLNGPNGLIFQGQEHDRNASSVFVRVIQIENRCYPFFAFLSSPLLSPQEKIVAKLNYRKPSKTALIQKEINDSNYLEQPSDRILADFQKYLTQNAKVLEVDERWQR